MIPHNTSRIRGKTHRLINSRYPPIDVFDGLYDTEEEKRLAFELELATNPRANTIIGRLNALPLNSLPVEGGGNGASYIVAAFIYTAETGGRFNTEALGAWYAARDVKTAIEETVHHNEKRLRASVGGFPNKIHLRELVCIVDVSLVDIRGAQKKSHDLYDPDDYSQSQAFASQIRWPFNDPGQNGIVYDSVRNDGGENIVIFRPQAMKLPVLQGDHFQYDWDSSGNVTVSKITGLQ